MGTAIKIGLGIFIGVVLLIGACGLLIAAGTNLEEDAGFQDTGGGDTGLEDTGGGTGGSSEPTRSPQRTRRFSGDGSKNIGTIRVTDDAVLTWKAKGDGYGNRLFAVSDKEFKLNVSSEGAKGRSSVEPGTIAASRSMPSVTGR
jgi:hypothetical protein